MKYLNLLKLNKERIIIFLSFILFNILLTFSIEFIHKMSVTNVLSWAKTTPFLFFINFLLVISITGLFISIAGRIVKGTIAGSLLLFLFVIISSYKQSYLGDPIYPWDFYLWKNVLNLLPQINLKVQPLHIAVLVAFILIFFLIFKFSKEYKCNVYNRIVIAILACTTIYLFTANTYFQYTYLRNKKVDNIFWDQKLNYKKNGLVFTFASNIHHLVIKSPLNYSESDITIGVDDIIQTVNASSTEHKKPNIIVVMSEAFWDPKLLPEVDFSKDPIPNVTSLSKTSTTGEFISPVFGGKTANAEFEVLTGHANKFLPQGSVPYQQHINRPTQSVASVLRDNGYSTTAVHTYYKWFFDRHKVYKFLGFDNFIALEDLSNPEMKGFYVSDTQMAKIIINEFEEKRSDKPMFLFSVSMQNHGPYDDESRYTQLDVTASSNVLSKEGLSIVQTYAQGAYDADNSLKILVDYFSKVNEPTTIIFFGDHLPMLGYGFKAYKESGYIDSAKETEWSLKENAKMHSTPLVVWNNYGASKEDVGKIGANFLSQYILDISGVEMPVYFKFLKEKFKYTRASIDNLIIDSNNNYRPEPKGILKEYEDKHWLFEYDMLFGKNYIIKK